jgi:hypothetical protein
LNAKRGVSLAYSRKTTKKDHSSSETTYDSKTISSSHWHERGLLQLCFAGTFGLPAGLLFELASQKKQVVLAHRQM